MLSFRIPVLLIYQKPATAIFRRTAAEQQLLKWKENKTQHSLPVVTEANIHLRHAIVLWDLRSQPVRNRAKQSKEPLAREY